MRLIYDGRNHDETNNILLLLYSNQTKSIEKIRFKIKRKNFSTQFAIKVININYFLTQLAPDNPLL